jgi:tetratricopeptide (TPR) repeat protein
MDPLVLIATSAAVITIVAGGVTVLQYVEGRRQRQKHPVAEEDTTSPPPETHIPNNLPPRSEFIGREKEKSRVLEALASRWPLTCIDGIGGIGKTALALEVAVGCLRASRGEDPSDGIPTFNGFIWNTAKDRELTLNDLLDAVARTLDYPGIAQQPLEEKQESVRKLLQSNNYLLLVDNFETVTDEAVRDFLLRLPEPSKALITSREQNLRQAWAVSLKGLEQDEALALIRSEGRRLGLSSLDGAEEQVLLRLYQATGGAPLAIKWAVGQIKQKGQSLDMVLIALHEAKGDIFEEIFARSWSLLSEGAQHILMVMPLFATSAARGAIDAASDVHHFALDEGLGQLVEMWLVEATDDLEMAKRRYSIHSLTRSFALAKLIQNPEFNRVAHVHLVDYFIRTTGGFGRDDWDWTGFDVLELERQNIMALLEWCHVQGMWKEIINIKKGIWNFLHVRGYWQDSLHCGLLAIEASRALNNQEELAWHLVFGVGWTYLNLGNIDKAEIIAREALTISEQYGYQKSRALALSNLGAIARRNGDLEQSQEMYRTSREIWQQLGQSQWAAVALGGLATTTFQGKEYAEAQNLFEQALQENIKLNHEPLIGFTWMWLANVARAKGDLEKAKRLYRESLKFAADLKRPLHIAMNNLWLARISVEERDYQKALQLGSEARKAYRLLGAERQVEEVEAFLEDVRAKAQKGKV